MKNTYTAAIKQGRGWWIGWIEEVLSGKNKRRIIEKFAGNIGIQK